MICTFYIQILAADEPLPVLEKWAAHLDARRHHPNAVGVQFVQIGNEMRCREALLALTRGNVRVSTREFPFKYCLSRALLQNMVDTVPYNGAITQGRLTRILLGAVKPSVRGNIS